MKPERARLAARVLVWGLAVPLVVSAGLVGSCWLLGLMARAFALAFLNGWGAL